MTLGGDILGGVQVLHTKRGNVLVVMKSPDKSVCCLVRKHTVNQMVKSLWFSPSGASDEERGATQVYEVIREGAHQEFEGFLGQGQSMKSFNLFQGANVVPEDNVRHPHNPCLGPTVPPVCGQRFPGGLDHRVAEKGSGEGESPGEREVWVQSVVGFQLPEGVEARSPKGGESAVSVPL